MSRNALLGLLGLSLGAAACSPGGSVHHFRSGSTAEQYLAEYTEFEKIYPDGDRSRATSPDGTAEVFLEPGRSWFDSDTCHQVSLRTSRNPHRKVVRLRERDRGSGTSFGFGWSRDGRAVFLSGGHSGLGCPIRRTGGALRIIFTLADQVAWELPPRFDAQP